MESRIYDLWGRPKVEEVLAYWPALIPKSAVASKVEVITV
jgi:hypothetical protein